MTRKELQVLKRDSLLALKSLFALSLTPEQSYTDYGDQVHAANAMHKAACRELAFFTPAALDPQQRAELAQAVAELDTAIGGAGMRNEHIRLAIRLILQVMCRSDEAEGPGVADSKEGFPP